MGGFLLTKIFVFANDCSSGQGMWKVKKGKHYETIFGYT